MVSSRVLFPRTIDYTCPIHAVQLYIMHIPCIRLPHPVTAAYRVIAHNSARAQLVLAAYMLHHLESTPFEAQMDRRYIL